MGRDNPNRISAGKKGAGRFDYKRHTESDLELCSENIEDYERGGFYSPYDQWDDIKSSYLSDIEENPTAEGVAAAAKKYRKEIVRLGETMNRSLHKDAAIRMRKELVQKSLKGLGLGITECDSKNFSYDASAMEVQAVARVNDIRNRQLEEKYGKYSGEFPEGPAEIELTTSNFKGEWSGVIRRGTKGNRSPLLIKPGYEESEAMRRSVHRAIDGTAADASYPELGDAVKFDHDSGFGASYLLTRRFDVHAEKAVFSETLIVPTERETERIELGTKAISEGWL